MMIFAALLISQKTLSMSYIWCTFLSSSTRRIAICASLLVLSFVHSGFSQNGDKELTQRFAQSKIFNEIFTGFALYDPSTKQYLHQHEADKYYTPASNVKLFTLYISLKVLGDSIPAFYYQETDSTFVFWGSGSPTFLYDRLPADSSVITFLQAQTKPLHYMVLPTSTPRFGPGWSWDDYLYTYQSERSHFPIYGNAVLFRHRRNNVGFATFPSYFQNSVQLDPTLSNDRARFGRAMDRNQFYCNATALAGAQYERYVPFRCSNELFLELLSDTLKRTIQLETEPIQMDDVRAFYPDLPADSVYQLMIQESDNFLAEQLLMTTAGYLLGVQDTDAGIDYLQKNYLQNWIDEPIWVDGSGLSRYNLFTPRSFVQLLDNLYQLMPEERLLNLFPAGGQSGTIEGWYAPNKGQPPYVFAKTGTLSNKHCLSGYLKTKSGKTLIFSFMHNNYIGSSRPVKLEMEQFLKYIVTKY